MNAASPATQVEGTLEEQLTVAGRQQVCGENDEGIGPDQECMLHTPPSVIVEMTLGEEGEGGEGDVIPPL